MNKSTKTLTKTEGNRTESMTFTMISENEIRVDHRYPSGIQGRLGVACLNMRKTRAQADALWDSAVKVGWSSATV